jgi:hypothetical protein
MRLRNCRRRGRGAMWCGLGRRVRVDEEQNEKGGDASSQGASLSPLHCLLDCRKRISAGASWWRNVRAAAKRWGRGVLAHRPQESTHDRPEDQDSFTHQHLTTLNSLQNQTPCPAFPLDLCQHTLDNRLSRLLKASRRLCWRGLTRRRLSSRT